MTSNLSAARRAVARMAFTTRRYTTSLQNQNLVRPIWPEVCDDFTLHIYIVKDENLVCHSTRSDTNYDIAIRVSGLMPVEKTSRGPG
jgi:hypothetical protein